MRLHYEEIMHFLIWISLNIRKTESLNYDDENFDLDGIPFISFNHIKYNETKNNGEEKLMLTPKIYVNLKDDPKNNSVVNSNKTRKNSSNSNLKYSSPLGIGEIFPKRNVIKATLSGTEDNGDLSYTTSKVHTIGKDKYEKDGQKCTEKSPPLLGRKNVGSILMSNYTAEQGFVDKSNSCPNDILSFEDRTGNNSGTIENKMKDIDTDSLSNFFDSLATMLNFLNPKLLNFLEMSIKKEQIRKKIKKDSLTNYSLNTITDKIYSNSLKSIACDCDYCKTGKPDTALLIVSGKKLKNNATYHRLIYKSKHFPSKPSCLHSTSFTYNTDIIRNINASNNSNIFISTTIEPKVSENAYKKPYDGIIENETSFPVRLYTPKEKLKQDFLYHTPSELLITTVSKERKELSFTPLNYNYFISKNTYDYYKQKVLPTSGGRLAKGREKEEIKDIEEYAKRKMNSDIIEINTHLSNSDKNKSSFTDSINYKNDFSLKNVEGVNYTTVLNESNLHLTEIEKESIRPDDMKIINIPQVYDDTLRKKNADIFKLRSQNNVYKIDKEYHNAFSDKQINLTKNITTPNGIDEPLTASVKDHIALEEDFVQTERSTNVVFYKTKKVEEKRIFKNNTFISTEELKKSPNESINAKHEKKINQPLFEKKAKPREINIDISSDEEQSTSEMPFIPFVQNIPVNPKSINGRSTRLYQIRKNGSFRKDRSFFGKKYCKPNGICTKPLVQSSKFNEEYENVLLHHRPWGSRKVNKGTERRAINVKSTSSCTYLLGKSTTPGLEIPITIININPYNKKEKYPYYNLDLRKIVGDAEIDEKIMVS